VFARMRACLQAIRSSLVTATKLSLVTTTWADLSPLSRCQKNGEARIVNHSSGARKGFVFGCSPLEAKYLGKNSGNLGGDGNSIMFNGGRWERYHQVAGRPRGYPHHHLLCVCAHLMLS
jgi:hypothetical protein